MKVLIAAATLLAAAPAVGQTVAGPPAPDVPRAKAAEGPGEVSRNAPVNGVLTLFGNERCPTDGEGNEIVVCVRRSANEQFRVPKELREFQITPENQSWAAKAQGTLDAGVGVNGIDSCSVVGPGGQSGCLAQQAQANRQMNQERKQQEARIP